MKWRRIAHLVPLRAVIVVVVPMGGAGAVLDREPRQVSTRLKTQSPATGTYRSRERERCERERWWRSRLLLRLRERLRLRLDRLCLDEDDRLLSPSADPDSLSPLLRFWGESAADAVAAAAAVVAATAAAAAAAAAALSALRCATHPAVARWNT